MSRTDKDIPYWVRAVREGRITHDHYYYNMAQRRNINKKRRKLDENGNPAFETAISTGVLIGWDVFAEFEPVTYRSDLFFTNTLENRKILQKTRIEENVFLVPRYGTTTREYPDFEWVTVGHFALPHECTDELVKETFTQHHTSINKYRDDYPICDFEIERWKTRRKYVAPKKSQRRDYQAQGRRQEKNQLTNIAKDYNSREDLYDYDLSAIDTRSKMRNWV